MGFLFGDLTPAPFSTNFLEELRDAIEVYVAIADTDQVIVTADARAEGLRNAASADLERVELLVRSVLEAARAGEGPKDAETLEARGEYFPRRRSLRPVRRALREASVRDVPPRGSAPGPPADVLRQGTTFAERRV